VRRALTTARAGRSLAFGLLAYGCGAPWSAALATAALLWVSMLNSHADCWRVKNAGQAVDMMFLGLVRGVGGLARVGGLLDDWNAYAELAWGRLSERPYWCLFRERSYDRSRGKP
jgi:hypothetical protein